MLLSTGRNLTSFQGLSGPLQLSRKVSEQLRLVLIGTRLVTFDTVRDPSLAKEPPDFEYHLSHLLIPRNSCVSRISK